MKRLLTILFVSVWFCGSAQTPADLKREQDSIVALNAAIDKFADSISKKVSIADVVRWAEDRYSVTFYKDAKFVVVYSDWLQFQIDLFIQSRKKKK